MATPEQAPELARRAAAQMRREGAYAELEIEPAGGPAPPDAGPLALYRWAMIEPSRREVRSTRRLGAPITMLKQMLLRLLAQYHEQLTAQQTRFNVALLRHVDSLEARVADLERRLGGAPGPGPDPPSTLMPASTPAPAPSPVPVSTPGESATTPGEPPTGTASR